MVGADETMELWPLLLILHVHAMYMLRNRNVRTDKYFIDIRCVISFLMSSLPIYQCDQMAKSFLNIWPFLTI